MNEINTVLASIYKFYFGSAAGVLSHTASAIERNELAQAMNSFLSTLELQRRIQDFKVIVDDSVNTPATVDLGYTNVLVFWKPVNNPVIKIFAAGEPQWVAASTRPRVPVPLEA